MSSNKKDICPVCGINEKGVQSKSCRPCALKKLTNPSLTPAKSTTESKDKDEARLKAQADVKAELEAKLKAMPDSGFAPDPTYLTINEPESETGSMPLDSPEYEPGNHLPADHEWCQSIIDGLMKERDECLDEIEKIKAENADKSESESESKPTNTVGQLTPDGKYYV